MAWDVPTRVYSIDGKLALPFQIRDNCVECPLGVLDLKRRQRILSLFELIIYAPGYELYKEDLINILYRSAYLRAVSARQYECHQHSAIKLVSRARKEAQESFPSPQPIVWFPYDPHRDSWSLYKYVWRPADAERAWVA